MSHRITVRERIAVIGVLLIAFALRTIDLTRVPPGLHNDEVVAAKLAESVMNGRVAIFFPEDTGSEPLHYYFAAPIMRVLGSSVFALRLPSIALSMMAMCVIWAFARRLFGPIVALTALIGFAIAFWTVEFGRIVSPVVMMVPLVSLAAYSFWRATASSGRRSLILFMLSGVSSGLALLAYTASRIVPAIFLAFGVYVLLARRAEWKRWWAGIVLTLGVAVAVSAPMFIYLVQHPEDDQLSFFDIDRPLTELQRGNLAPVIETSKRTLGMFAFVGDPLPYYDVPAHGCPPQAPGAPSPTWLSYRTFTEMVYDCEGRPILEPLGALLLVIGLLMSLWHWRKVEYAFVVIWFFVSLAPGMLSQPAPNYTRTLGVQTVLFIFIGMAVAVWVRRFPNRLTYVALTVILAGNVLWTAHDYFTLWPSIATVRFWHQTGLKTVTDQLQTDPDASPVAICLPDYLIDEREPWWKPAWQHVHYLLQRPDVQVRYYNCADTVVLIDGPARYAFPDAADVEALKQFPIYSQFLADAIPDRIQLPDRLGVILRATSSLDQLSREVASASQVAFDGRPDTTQPPIDFDGKAEFLGYTLSTATLNPGAPFDLVTYWRVTDRLPPQLSQFTHVLNDKGEIVAQQDRLMLTSQSLQRGDVFAQLHHMELSGDVKAGEYPIAIGLYTQPDGQRLSIVQDQQPRGTRLFLQPIHVK